jgi:hypothetical protein
MEDVFGVKAHIGWQNSSIGFEILRSVFMWISVGTLLLGVFLILRSFVM